VEIVHAIESQGEQEDGEDDRQQRNDLLRQPGERDRHRQATDGRRQGEQQT
jgi:hypothetical protein